MATEYKTNWDGSWAEILNKELPAKLKEIEFETWDSELMVVDGAGNRNYIKGQQFIKIIITTDEKELFVSALKGIMLDKNFPLMLQIFIQDNLGYLVNRKYVA